MRGGTITVAELDVSNLQDIRFVDPLCFIAETHDSCVVRNFTGHVYDSLFNVDLALSLCDPLASHRSRERERAIADLGRLRDDWAGPGSKSPKASVIRNVEQIFSAFDNDTSTPNIEVDGEDGSATVYWQIGREAFSLMIGGEGKITGVLSPSRPDYKIWTISDREVEKLARRLEDPAIAHLIKG
jgi:hypothetical protein